MTPVRMRVWAIGAMLCIAAAALRAETAPVLDGAVTITLGGAVPYTGRNEPSVFAGPRNTFRDLRIDLVCRGGNWDANVWAFSECMPAVEHKGELTTAQADANAASVRLEIDLPISHHLPLVLGGRCRYVIDLRRVGKRLTGTFTGSSSVPTSKAELETLANEWALGGAKKTKAEWVGQLVAQESLKGDAVGEIQVSRAFLPAPCRPHPRLFFDANELPALKARAGEGLGAKSVAAMEKLLESMEAEDVPVSPDDADGYAAAGWALLHVLRGDANAAERAGRWARRAIVSRPALPPVGAARKVAGVAVAYDLCRGAWPAELRKDAAAWLAAEARQIATLRRTAGVSDEMSVRPWAVQGAYDYRLAMFRGAAGLAALAVGGEEEGSRQQGAGSRGEGTEGSRQQGAGSRGEGTELADVRTICGRSVRRFLQVAVGERGCDAGGCGYEKVLETVLPLVQASRRCGGCDLAEGTGAGHIGLWAMMTDGRTFASAAPPPLHWLPMAMGVLEERYRPLAAEYARRAASGELALSTPWHGMMMLLNAPNADANATNGPSETGEPKTYAAEAGRPRSNAGILARDPNATEKRPEVKRRIPLRIEDREMGGYVFRSGWGRNDAVTVFQRAGGPFPAAHQAGNFTVAALGREWITRPAAPAGDFQWPGRELLNVVRINAAAQRDALQAAYPAAGGRTLSVRPCGASGGCVAIENDLFSHEDIRATAAGALGAEARAISGGRLRRTLAVDYSGVSGAEVLIVIVDEVYGFLPRQPVWQVFVGPLGKERVTIDGGEFRVAPEGTAATMAGTVLHPAGAVLEYVSPAAGPRGGQGRVEAWFGPRGATNAELFGQSQEKKRKAVGDWLEQDALEREHAERMEAKPGKYEDGRGGGEKGLTDLVAERMMKEVAGVDADRANRRRELRESRAAGVLAKLAANTSVDPLHGGDRVERARGTFVTVLTIQSGAAPKVVVADKSAPEMFTVGRQAVRYSENVIEFGAGKSNNDKHR